MKRLFVKLAILAALTSVYSFADDPIIAGGGPSCQSGDGRFSCSCFAGEICTAGADWCTCGSAN